jgi:hypothetical protein
MLIPVKSKKFYFLFTTSSNGNKVSLNHQIKVPSVESDTGEVRYLTLPCWDRYTASGVPSFPTIRNLAAGCGNEAGLATCEAVKGSSKVPELSFPYSLPGTGVKSVAKPSGSFLPSLQGNLQRNESKVPSHRYL